MPRQIWVAFAFVLASACGKPNPTQETAPVPGGDQKVQVPGAGGDKVAVPNANGPSGSSGGTPGGAAIDDPRFHLQPEEGTLTIGKAEGKAGAPLVATINLAPTAGRHLATDYPIKIALEAPAGVTLTKAELTAGGRDKVQGDADTLTEQGLAFSVKATAAAAGTYEIKGTFKFGVCDSESCHPKKQPITIAVAAN